MVVIFLPLSRLSGITNPQHIKMSFRSQGHKLQNYNKGGSPQRSFPAKQFASEQQLSAHAFEAIQTLAHHQELLYTGVRPRWVVYIPQHLEERIDASKVLT
jgi:hypothetical protein